MKRSPPAVARPLRIAVVAPVATSVEPRTTWSIERIVSLLADELVARGHDVTLFATGQSRSRARLSSIFERGYSEDAELWDWRLCESLNVAAAIERSEEFDVIHSHAYHFALPFVRLSSAPIVHSYHVMPDHDVSKAFAMTPEAVLVALSRYHADSFAPARPRAVVGHGLPIDRAAARTSTAPYLLYLGRLMRDKGLFEAIDLARMVGIPLVVAGPKSDAYELAKLSFDDRAVTYLGPVDAPTRDRLLLEAAAFVYPILRGEPFGLVLIESMLAGTPVLAFDCGAVRELVDPGVTGFIAQDLASLSARVHAAIALDRGEVQRAAAARFDVGQMVDRYVELYASVQSSRR